MNDDKNLIDFEEEIEEQPTKELEFRCPNCGEKHQDEVVFLCNRCDSKEMIKKDGVYICPQCLVKGQNFMCMSCDSKEVKLKTQI